MKNVTKPLTTGYFNLLNNMVVDGKTVTFHYLKAPFPTVGPYILMNGLYTVNKNTRSSFCGETTVSLIIYTEFDGDYGSMDLADLIADEVLERVIPEPGKTNIVAQGFNVKGGRMIGMRDYETSSDTKSTYEKRISIEHLIDQL